MLDDSRCGARSLPADVVHLDLLQGLFAARERGAQLAVAIGAPCPGIVDQRKQFFVARARAQRRTQIHAGSREKTRVEDTLGGQSGARARAAERLGDRGYEADFSRTIVERVAFSDLAVIVLP